MSILKHLTGCTVLLVVAVGILSISCDSDDETGTSTVQFSTPTSNANEGDGEISIQVSASQSVSSDIEVTFEVLGSAYLNGDYILETPSPIIIKKGDKTATIVLNLLDESIIESTDDELEFRLTSIGDNASLSKTSDDLEHTLTIGDNDNVESDQFQIDLTWDLGEGEDIDQVNFDLYLATNVVIEDNTVTDADLYDGSENTIGFESLWITPDDDDAEYYIVVNYTEGNIDADFTINLNGGNGYADEHISDTFSADNTGGAVFYGPLTKSGSSIGRIRGMQKVVTLRRHTK